MDSSVTVRGIYMNKKFGFTLAEVLITMALLGVVATMTLPALRMNTQDAKIGPSLRKFINTLENANELLLNDKDVDKISDAVSNDEEYLNELEHYINGNSTTALTFNPSLSSYDGTEVSEGSGDLNGFNFKNGDSMFVAETSGEGQGSFKGIRALIFYDLNGSETRPNFLGKDVFVFWLDESGAVIPYGGKVANRAYGDSLAPIVWDGEGDLACKSRNVGSGISCAGSVADNDWKVIYSR